MIVVQIRIARMLDMQKIIACSSTVIYLGSRTEICRCNYRSSTLNYRYTKFTTVGTSNSFPKTRFNNALCRRASIEILEVLICSSNKSLACRMKKHQFPVNESGNVSVHWDAPCTHAPAACNLLRGGSPPPKMLI